MTRKNRSQGIKVSGAYFARWRERRNLTQEQISKDVCYARVSIAYWENFAVLPAKFVEAMDEFYGVRWRDDAERVDLGDDVLSVLYKLVTKVEALDRDVRRVLD